MLVRDGVLVAAAEEERFRREKHWAGFPAQAIGYCLREAGVDLSDVDHVAVNQDNRANLVRKLGYLPSKLNDAQRRSITRKIQSAQFRGSRRSALADDRSGAMDIRGVSRHDRQADAQPGAPRHGLSQAVGPATSSCAGRRCDRKF